MSCLHSRAVLRLAGLFLAWTLFVLPAAAQDSAGEGAAAGGQEERKVIPAMRTPVIDRLNEAQICMEEEDYECVDDQLNRIERIGELNNYERAQLWNFRAFLNISQDNVPGAINAYEELLAIPHEDITDGLIQTSMRNLATLYLGEERWEEGLATFQDYMALPTVVASARDYYILATIYYSMERWADGLPPLEEAIALARSNGEIGEEQWYQLKYALHFQLEQTEEVIDTLTTLVEHWTKRQWIRQLAGQLSGQGRVQDTLSLYEAAYEAGFLTQGSDWVQLANLYLDQGSPYKAGVVLETGLNDGTIESTEQNWRLLATAWQLAKEDEKALPAFARASSLAEDGEIDRLRTQSLVRLARWDECVEAARSALDRGGIDRRDLTYMFLGQCLYNLKRFDEARNAFQEAAEDDRQAAQARQWIRFVDIQVERERSNAEALERIARLEELARN